MSKSDKDQLKGILTQFDVNTIHEAINELMEKPGASIKTSDCKDRGSKLKPGEKGCCSLEDLGQLERVIAESNFLPVHFLEEGFLVQKAVARVTLTESYSGLPAGNGWATGFMVSPTIFMTNNHVIPSEAFCNKVEMQFNFQNDIDGSSLSTDNYDPDPNSFFYTNSDLDFTLVRLKRKCVYPFKKYSSTLLTGSRYGEISFDDAYEYTPNPDDPRPLPGSFIPLDVSFRRSSKPSITNFPGKVYWKVCTNAGQKWGFLPLRATIPYAEGQHLNIIQHPSGRKKEVAVQKNQTDEIYADAIRYTTDTEPGSSGSPVFDNSWDLMAILHAGGERNDGVWINNEGMRIDEIVSDVRTQFQNTNTTILNELGI